MHDDHFDQLLSSVVTGTPRRTFLSGLLGVAGVATANRAGAKKSKKKCKKGKKKCSKRCVDVQTDGDNCGACGNACPVDQTCSGGTCACPASQSFVAGACIPRFGCGPDLDTCDVGKKACPQFTNESDARCYVSAQGEPFCGTRFECGAFTPDATCPIGDGQPRIFIPCALCSAPGETGACVRQITQVRA